METDAKMHPTSETYRKKRYPKIDAEIWYQKNQNVARAMDFHRSQLPTAMHPLRALESCVPFKGGCIR